MYNVSPDILLKVVNILCNMVSAGYGRAKITGIPNPAYFRCRLARQWGPSP